MVHRGFVTKVRLQLRDVSSRAQETARSPATDASLTTAGIVCVREKLPIKDWAASVWLISIPDLPRLQHETSFFVIDFGDIEVSLGGWQKRSQQGCSEDGEFHDA